MAFPISLFAAVPFGPAPAQMTASQLIERAEALYAIVDEECQRQGREIVVCARQNENDRYRLPFETITPGDPDNEGVWAERERIQADPGTCQRASYFQVGCGAVGVSVGMGGADPGLRTGGLRRVGQ
ncbi:MAG: hypothetical protein AAGE05_12790 [Pseudomonadota bacterium]